MSKFRVRPNIAYLEMVLYLSVAEIEAESLTWHKHIWLLSHTSWFPGALMSFAFAWSGLEISPPPISTHLAQGRHPSDWSFSSYPPRYQWLCMYDALLEWNNRAFHQLKRQRFHSLFETLSRAQFCLNRISSLLDGKGEEESILFGKRRLPCSSLVVINYHHCQQYFQAPALARGKE